MADAVPTEDEVVSPEDAVTSGISSLVSSHDDSDGLVVASVVNSVVDDIVVPKDKVVSPKELVTAGILSSVSSHDDSVGLDIVSVVDSVITDVVILEVEEVV